MLIISTNLIRFFYSATPYEDWKIIVNARCLMVIDENWVVTNHFSFPAPSSVSSQTSATSWSVNLYPFIRTWFQGFGHGYNSIVFYTTFSSQARSWYFFSCLFSFMVISCSTAVLGTWKVLFSYSWFIKSDILAWMKLYVWVLFQTPATRRSI